MMPPVDIAHWVRQDRLEKVDQLIAAGADINKLCENGWTPLTAAANRAAPDMCRELILRGALVNQADNSGKKPIYWAADNADEATCSLLVAYGATAGRRDTGVCTNHIKTIISLPRLQAAIVTGNFQVLKDVLDARIGVGEKNSRGETAIEFAERRAAESGNPTAPMADYIRSWQAGLLASELLQDATTPSVKKKPKTVRAR